MKKIITITELISVFTNGNDKLDGYDVSQELLLDIVKMYFNDKNSSTLRELIMCEISDIEPSLKKLGYDGFGKIDREPHENKPQSYDTKNINASKLTGGGNYTDMTHRRHIKYFNDDVILHLAGFVDGILIYQFMVKYRELIEHFKKQLDKHLPNGDKTQTYLKSMTIPLTQLEKCDVKLEFITEDIEKYRKFLTDKCYNYIMGLKGI
jgi:hypothetical protein